MADETSEQYMVRMLAHVDRWRTDDLLRQVVAQALRKRLEERSTKSNIGLIYELLGEKEAAALLYLRFKHDILMTQHLEAKGSK